MFGRWRVPAAAPSIMAELTPDSANRPQVVELSAARLGAAAIVLATVINALWGTNPVALKLALEGLPPIGCSGIRFTIAAIGVAIWLRATGVDLRPRRSELPWLAAIGAIFSIQIATFTLGVHWGTASHSSVILNTYPFFVVAFAHFLIPGDRASLGKAAALLAAFSGIVVLFAGDWGAWSGTNLRGDLIQLASAIILGGQVVFTKHAVARAHPGRVVLYEMFIGGAFFVIFSLAFESLAHARPDPVSIGAVVYQGIVIGAICFSVWTWLIRRYSASLIAIFGFISPVVGVLLSALILGEPLTPALLLSAGLVAIGIVLANLW